MPFRQQLAALIFVAVCIDASAQVPTTNVARPCTSEPGWSDPARPAHIYGNTWYVGTCGISAILVTSPQGHVLIDGATGKAATMIEANIRALGFRVSDIRFILNSHEHLDHAGGIARLQQDSGATVVAREPAASVLERGTTDRSDPQFGSLDPFPPIGTIRRIRDRETLSFGILALTAHATPGHTAGSTSWTWQSCESGECRNMVYADSLSAISADGYRFSDEATHPGVVAGFRQSFKAIAALPCEILMTPHPGASHLLARLGPGASEPLVDPNACIRYADEARARLGARLEREATEAQR